MYAYIYAIFSYLIKLFHIPHNYYFLVQNYLSYFHVYFYIFQNLLTEGYKSSVSTECLFGTRLYCSQRSIEFESVPSVLENDAIRMYHYS